MLTIANRAVLEDTNLDHFVTLFFALLEPRPQMLIYCGAGHEAYLIKQSGETIKLESTSLPLGLEADTLFTCAEPIALETGQLLLLVTDGFQEAEAPDGRMFSSERLVNLACEHRLKPAQDIVNVLYREVRDFCHPRVHQDDVTAVVVKVGRRFD
jgi:sigma-B regulation protein RsbU (phosphoserine phosphatase)